MKRSPRSTPSGPGSRGGHYHDADWRLAYHRAWKAAHPEYRARERLRRLRERAVARGEDPTLVTEPTPYPPGLPLPVQYCGCGCGCVAEVVTVCGFCREGIHEP